MVKKTTSNNLLWHYTTPEGLIGIIESNSLWATDIFYLNDSEEFMIGIKIARDIIKQKKFLLGGEQKERLRRFDTDLSFIGPDHKRPVYVCSLSKAENELSQWIAYCRGGGFSIGFPHQGLIDAIQDQHFDLKECIYDVNKQKRIIINLIKSKVMPYVQNPGQFSKTPCTKQELSSKVCEGSIQFLWELFSICPILKHPSYEREEELRLVFDHKYTFEKGKNNKNKIKPKFRNKNGLIIPYICIRLPKNEDFWKQIRIIIGPTKYEKELKHSVHTLFKNKDYKTDISITVSGIPLREL
jgi:hypothetical protein